MSKKKQTAADVLTRLESFLDDQASRCDCDFGDEGEEGIIECLPCAIREHMGLQHTTKHLAGAQAAEKRDAARKAVSP